jgi:hypothetical protein
MKEWPMPIEYTCLDCGRRICSFIFVEPPELALCASCDWIRRCVPKRHQDAARERLGVPLLQTHE